jgi:hypothetical protein
LKGRVADKQQVEGRNEVHLDVWCENQRGVVTSPASAVVLLPNRQERTVQLPSPPAATAHELIDWDIDRLRTQDATTGN